VSPDDVVKYVVSKCPRSCDGIDGVLDGVIDDPRRCTFDPASL
jgi:feruloyl esterase